MAYLYSGIIIANTPKFICVFFFPDEQTKQRHVSVLMPHPLKSKLETMGRGSVCRKKAYMNRFLREERRK